MHVQFLGPTYQGRIGALDASRTINFYPELSGNPYGKSVVSLIGTPGSKLYFPVGGNGAIRGMHVTHGPGNVEGLVFASGNSVYTYAPSRGRVKIASLTTNTGPVCIRDNGLKQNTVGGDQILIVDGAAGYVFNMTTGVTTTVSGGGWPSTPTTCAFLKGWFAVTDGSMAFWFSDLYDGTTWNALSRGAATSSTETIQGLVTQNDALYVIKGMTTELWYPNGTATSAGCPFSPQSGSTILSGTYAPASISKGHNAIWMLGWRQSDDCPQFVGAIAMAGSETVVRSTPPITQRMQDIHRQFGATDAISFCFSDSGHDFVVFTFPAGDATFVYDTTIDMWHEWTTYRTLDPYSTGRHVAQCYAYFNGRHIIGDYSAPNLLEMAHDIYTDYESITGGTVPKIATRISPIARDDQSLRDLFVSEFRVDAEMGMIDPTLTPTPPYAVLSWSEDGGKTFGKEYAASIGMSGEYRQTLAWKRLGYGADNVYKLVMAGDHRKVLIDTYAEVGM